RQGGLVAGGSGAPPQGTRPGRFQSSDRSMTSSYIPKKLRQIVAEQARFRCGYCLSAEKVVGFAMEIEHLVPQALGGPSREENLWLACPACNAFKGQRISARDPLSGLTVRLFNPREQRWEEHFLWIDSGARIAGRTAIG